MQFSALLAEKAKVYAMSTVHVLPPFPSSGCRRSPRANRQCSHHAVQKATHIMAKTQVLNSMIAMRGMPDKVVGLC